MSNLEYALLGDLIEFKRGYDLPKSQFIKGTVPVRSSNGILGYHNEVKAKAPGITIGRSGTVGLPHLITEDFFPHNTSLYVKDFKGNDVHYIYYLLMFLKLDEWKSGSGVPTMNRNHLHPLNVPAYREIATQKAIAKVLSDIDAKIEVNNRINAKLEETAKLIYDYWFVQFDFPDANGKPYKTSGGKMVYNEELKREIPEGWEVGSVNDLTNKIIDHRGKTPKKMGADWTTSKDGIIALSAKVVKDGKLINLDKANKVDRALYERWMSDKLQEGDFLLTSEAPAGHFYFFVTDSEYCLSQRLFALRPKVDKVLPIYLYNEMSRGHGYSQILGKLSGSTVFGIRQEELRKIICVIPDMKLQKLFKKSVYDFYQQIDSLTKQNQQLAKLRDWLLPMLMNGQVVVK